jgi:hypothetical protein
MSTSTDAPAAVSWFRPMEPVRVYGELDPCTQTLVVRDAGVLPPAGAYDGHLRVEAPGEADRSVAVRVVVPVRGDGRLVGALRRLTLSGPVPLDATPEASASVTFVAVLTATNLPAAAA